MKKALVIILCTVLAVSLTACSVKRPKGIQIENSVEEFPEEITFLMENQWPENEYTHGIPIPPGIVAWCMLDTKENSCGIQLGDITKAQFEVYYEKLLASGFSEIEKVKERSRGSISIGTLLSDGSKSLSLAYGESVLMMTVVNEGIDGFKGGILGIGNLTNVYVSAYSTYHAENGVQIVTELYVPKGQRPAPRFSGVKGIVTLRIGNSTTVYHLGTDAEAAAVGLAVNSEQLGSSGEKGFVVVAGTAYADNAAIGCGSFAVAYEITIP